MFLLSVAVALVFTAAYYFGYLPHYVVLGYGVMSALTFILYGLDKHAAIHGRRRVREANLQLVALLGGWPGALLAQQWFRHKNRKASFQMVFWLVSVLNTGLAVGGAIWL